MRIIMLTLAIFAFVSLTLAQDKSAELSQIDDKLVRTVEEQMPGWQHEVVTPMQGSTDVAINNWMLDKKTVSVTIIRFATDQAAATSIRQFATDMKGRNEVSDVGDELYSLTAANTSFVFRKGHFTVYINTKSTDQNDEKRLEKTVGRFVVDSIAKH